MIAKLRAPAALARGLQAIEALVQARDGLRFVDLGKQLGCGDASLARLLRSLETLGYVERSVDGRYRAANLERLTPPATLFDAIGRIAQIYLPRIMDAAQTTAMAVAWTGAETICVGREFHEDGLPLQRPGLVRRNHRYTPWGWFLMGREHWIEANGFDPDEPWPMPELGLILRELDRLDAHGYCMHWQPNRRRVAAPIRSGGRIVGAFAIGGGASTLPDDKLAERSAFLADAARQASALL